MKYFIIALMLSIVHFQHFAALNAPLSSSVPFAESAAPIQVS